MEVNLTVGQVSGIIAAGAVVAKLILPTLCAFIFIGTLRERNNAATTTAVAWSSVGRLLHSSYWPTILSSDSAVFTGVPFRVLFFRYAGILCTMLISIAAIITPLGLYESIVPGPQKPEKFHYLPDSGIFGTGTMARNESVPWSRACGGHIEAFTCPDLTRGISSDNETMNRRMPQETIDLFSSGVSASSTSISSIFDIQWRQWMWTRLSKRNRSNFTMPTHPSFYEPYPIGIYRQISTIVLEDGYTLIDGLVVDTTRGSVGFRNHSAPPLTTYGSTWSEDLLFVQPVSTCVDTNLTLDYAINDHDSYNVGTTMTPISLTDRGGFSRLNTTYPTWDPAAVQSNPQLWERAYQAAWSSNIFALSKLNISNVTLGTDPGQPLRLLDSSIVPGAEVFPLGPGSPGACYLDTQNAAAIVPNQFGCYVEDSLGVPEDGTFDASLRVIRDLCEGGHYDESRGTLGNIATYCTLMFGASQRSDGSADDESHDWPLHAPNTAWSVPMYSCAMAVEATIQTVTFSFNTTDDLTGLTVLNITDKTYASAAEHPLWAVENSGVDMDPFWMRPLWGLISHEAAAKYTTQQLKTVQKPSLLLPRTTMYPRGGLVTEYSQNLPGAEFADNGMNAVSGMAFGSIGLMDYTGEGNLALSRRWNMLSRSPESMAKVMNLVWTDYAANAVVGTKGSPRQPADSNSSSSNAIIRRITTYRTAIRYHLAYAIPALIVLAILTLASFLALIALLLGRATLGKMKRYLNATSAGRIMVSVLHRPLVMARGADNDTPTDEWIQAEGTVVVTTGKMLPVPVLEPGMGVVERSTLLKGPVVGQERLQA
ncbi:hypothetical protein BDV12DRAFT_208837 [Aspergillus spectabilis]